MSHKEIVPQVKYTGAQVNTKRLYINPLMDMLVYLFFVCCTFLIPLMLDIVELCIHNHIREIASYVSSA